MTSSNLKINVKSTNRLYFDQYKFCASAFLPYASSLRKHSHEHINKSLELRQHLHQSYPDLRALINGQYLRNPPITEYVRYDLHHFLDTIKDIEQDFKIVYKKHYFHCYTNDTAVVDSILYEGLLDRKLTQLKIEYEPGTIVRKRADYKYRCYLKSTQISESTKESIRRFFQSHPDISVANSFQQWLKNSYKYSSSHYFFDFNDKGIQLMFEIAAPGVIRETFTIITEDEVTRG